MNLQERITEYMNNISRPLLAEDIAEGMELKGGEVAELFAALDELENKAVLVKNRSGLYGLPARMNLAVGTLSMTSKGFGFIVPDDRTSEEETDIFIPGGLLMGAMHGDRVLARLSQSPRAAGRSREGEVIRIVEHANKRVVGVFEKSKAFGFVTPDNQKIGQDIFIPKEYFSGAKIGTKVVCEITKWPSANRRSPEGKIIEVLGKVGEPGVDVLSVMRQFELTEEFPDKVQLAAEKTPQNVLPEEYEGRLDRRSFTTVTIDGDDSKDFDDAVYAEKRPDGLFLGVYIADVSWYVRENAPLDREAKERATSVYLVDRVIPMLPKELSNGICSLNEGEDRLAMACEMMLDPDGKIASYQIAPAVIRVYRRLTYNIVNKILVDKDPLFVEDNADILPMLEMLSEVRKKRRALRQRRGSIDFSVPEIKVRLDDKGNPVAIMKREGSLSESLIEECMLAANETVAEHIEKKKLPFIYRVHENPKSEKIEQLNTLLAGFGQHINMDRDGNIKPIDIQHILAVVKGKPEEKIVSKVALRSMQQARYSPDNLGHFGLAAKYYTHFTSPIRRYPDLIVHRILRETFPTGTIDGKRRNKLATLVPEWAEHSSLRERVAAEAERTTTEMKAIEYMAQFVGETFSGIISGVTAFGIFVELETGVEGLVHVSRMTNDYYEYDEAEFALKGERNGEIYRLGDEIEVILVRADVETREIDLIIKGNGVYNSAEKTPSVSRQSGRSNNSFRSSEAEGKKGHHRKKEKSAKRPGKSKKNKSFEKETGKKKASGKGRKKYNKRRNSKS